MDTAMELFGRHTYSVFQQMQDEALRFWTALIAPSAKPNLT